MLLEVKEIRSATVIAVGGSIRAEDNRRFSQVLQGVRAPGCRAVLDVSELDYINSGALGELVKFVQQVRVKGGALVVVNPRPLVEKIMRAVGLFTLIGTRETVEEAIKAWGL